jgi:hypothetical protein
MKPGLDGFPHASFPISLAASRAMLSRELGSAGPTGSPSASYNAPYATSVRAIFMCARQSLTTRRFAPRALLTAGERAGAQTSAQPIELFALAGGQAVAAQAFIERRLLDPFPDRVGRGLELSCELVDLSPPSAPIRRFAAGILARTVDDFAALGTSFFLSPQHRQPNRVKSTGLRHSPGRCANCARVVAMRAAHRHRRRLKW